MHTYIDTHTHLYLEQFEQDRSEVVKNAIDEGVRYMLLPNVDSTTLDPLLKLCGEFPGNCLPMVGLHPTSVKPGYEAVLEKMRLAFQNHGNIVAVGETGIDLYWDKTHYDLQVKSFRTQIEWALELNLPVVVHSRNSTREIMEVLEDFRGRGLQGVMHCFPGNVQEAKWFTDFGFLLGIGGVVTYKNSEMAKVVEAVDLDHLMLETDAPYLTPVPHRGKRNESRYIPFIARKIAEIKSIGVPEVASVTTRNATELFKIS